MNDLKFYWECRIGDADWVEAYPRKEFGAALEALYMNQSFGDVMHIHLAFPNAVTFDNKTVEYRRMVRL